MSSREHGGRSVRLRLSAQRIAPRCDHREYWLIHSHRGSQLSDREVERLLANLETNPAAPAQSPVPASLFPRHYPCQQRLIAPARQNVSGRFSMAGFEVITYGRF